ncbi:hypothetical protein EB796_004591 [Bugula neritina]|uniref:Uncharacterized protein n=1 Tax=Bugula neritina TaxID=10212 RepID=A0A7J7KFT5_BUGNE|nr:hypothetical protein EB796_004591 [Bugula neritina]
MVTMDVFNQIKLVTHHSTTFICDVIHLSTIVDLFLNNSLWLIEGPTHATIEDFWLMIWQQQITSVVMATKAFETNKMKCLQYWPIAEKESQTIGEFRITNMGVEKWPDYAITRLKVIKGADEKWLTHFQFLSWPDHDVPDTSQPFLSFYRKFSRRVDVNSGPILVHCSAGVGRSGAIIALDYLFEQARAESRVDFFKCVVKMRERRPNMIQTQEQYLFVHNALYDLLSTEGFLTLTDMLITKKDDKKALSKEYEYIESTLSKVPTITDSGQLPENLPLNRYKHILPDDKFRIYLSGRDNQTYINAIRVNGYHKVDQFYATQIPLEQTIKDLWQLVHERSCKVIVQLGDSPDSTEYYPTTVGTGYSYGSGVHTVTAKSYTERGPLQLFQLEHALEKRNLLKEPRIYSETSEITLIKLPQNLCYKTNIQPMHMISVVEQLVRLTEKMGDINVLVVSSDGAGLCGAFICAFNCLESIRLTQEVEVYNQVLMAKYRRRQFISTFEEYSHIYHILSAYVDQFSQYQNVSCM